MVLTRSQANSKANPTNSKANKHSNHPPDDAQPSGAVPGGPGIVLPPWVLNHDEQINSLPKAFRTEVQAMVVALRMLWLR
ncbi:hypothetical protein CDL15_Pgr013170 [Punica granatum]|uniref:Uncharacterized protein n=1 Tax=Punica granatum TaxID=22663 RepID=A0A218WER8_PUNGR|nr:hypothetical protein CDL15_Pgr013170 [Punica granatum]